VYYLCYEIGSAQLLITVAAVNKQLVLDVINLEEDIVFDLILIVVVFAITHTNPIFSNITKIL
jgi:hypothetical protein